MREFFANLEWNNEALTWMIIFLVAAFSTAGDVLMARAMKEIGDLDTIRQRSGLKGAIKVVVTSPRFMVGLFCMAAAFYSVLTAVSLADVSLVAPAAAALTFLSNAIIAHLYLKEAVTKRRWASAALICCGVYLLR
ncbi:MAG: EamA family transporter [Acidobacteriaceae bacterium]